MDNFVSSIENVIMAGLLVSDAISYLYTITLYFFMLGHSYLNYFRFLV